MDGAKVRRSVTLLASAALLASLTVTAAGAPVGAKTDKETRAAAEVEQLTRAEARAEAKAAKKQAKAEKKAAKTQARADRKAEKQARKLARAKARSAAKSVCKDGGWKTLAPVEGDSFKSQGQCVKFVVHGGTPTPTGTSTPPCTYTFPQDTGFHPYDGDIQKGERFCGGPGHDQVNGTMYGGTFEGGDGIDKVGTLYGGTFEGGDGNDSVGHHGGDPATYGASAFNGGPGDDWVEDMWFGTFDGGLGDDYVWTYHSGACRDVEDPQGCPAP